MRTFVPHLKLSGHWRILGLLLLTTAGVLALASLCERLVRLSTGRPANLEGVTFNTFALTAGVFGAVVAITFALTRRLALAFAATGTLFALVATAHVRKLVALDVPLMVWDLLQWRAVSTLLPSLASTGQILLAALGASVLLAAAVLAWRGVPPARIGLPARLLLAAAGCIYLAALAHPKHPWVEPALKRLNVINWFWEPRPNAERNGFLLPLVMNAGALELIPPPYSEASVRGALAGCTPPGPAAPAPDEAPHVVVYMAEAFWDPTQLGVRFSRDPIPFFRSLVEGGPRRELVSPVFGGGTANVEFEILTGIPGLIFPPGTYPYSHFLRRPVRALPALFREAGYRTVALHNWHRWFWNRHLVYPLLGFDQFDALDALEPIPRLGPYPSDEPLAERIVRELRSATRPTFTFAISMVTHGPYDYPAPPESSLRVLDPLSSDSRHVLENYANAMHHADQALAGLVTGLAGLPRKTILVVFGDHLPVLGDRYGVYRETEFVPELVSDNEERLHRVQLAVWSNRPTVMEEPPSAMSMSFLGPYVLGWAGIPKPRYFGCMADLSRRVPVLERSVAADRARPAETSPEFERLRLLGFDLLMGEGYALQPEPAVALETR